MNEKLRKARKDRHWSIEVAAEKIGVSRTTYLRWEHGGQTPHDSTILLACDAFKMSAEQLGFGSPVSTTGTSLIQTRSVQFPITNSSTADMFSVGLQALVLAQHQYGWSFDELHSRTEQEMRRLDMKHENDEKMTRRQTLGFLAGLPVAFLGMTQASSTTQLPAEEVLPLYVSGVPACWRLYFDGEMAEVSRVLPSYISQLTFLAHQPSKYQKVAASLLSQAHQLEADVVLQTEDFGSSLAHCKEALTYAQVAGDSNVVVASLIRKANTLFYRQRSTLSTNQEALQYIDDISPLLRSRIYSELGAVLAPYPDQKQEALRYMELAHEAFPDNPQSDPGYQYTHSNQYILHLNTMLTYLKVKDADEAWLAIKKAGAFVPAAVSPRRMEYLKHMVIGSIALGDLELTCANLETMIASASILESDLWRNDLQSTYDLLPDTWKGEKRVKEIAEQLQM